MDSQAVKRERHPARGQVVRCQEINGPCRSKVDQNILQPIVGDANESPAIVNDVSCTCLVDTGSQVTTICKSFIEKHLLNLPISPLQDLLFAEGAGGQDVLYVG